MLKILKVKNKGKYHFNKSKESTLKERKKWKTLKKYRERKRHWKKEKVEKVKRKKWIKNKFFFLQLFNYILKWDSDYIFQICV